MSVAKPNSPRSTQELEEMFKLAQEFYKHSTILQKDNNLSLQAQQGCRNTKFCCHIT